ncbi:hypothetical protein QBC47DRAFT_396297 [Echria macrotheca]|uniref:Thymocyte nuclear protein 1 n=1 Tax=Echria macrotheca TaxID=438768 RepID=A0AAJ0BL56_9PEZI|nr:hypothetical protein QBC47DRAFT_396297 [Echria macrotheca]
MPKRKSAPAEEGTQRRRSVRIASVNGTEPPKAGAKLATKKTQKTTKRSKPEEAVSSGSEPESEPQPKKSRTAKLPKTKPEPKSTKAKAKPPIPSVDSGSEKTYWLLKAEPESRLENGVDVKFSIDDLAAKTEPEPWDGIRAYAARNNLRAMKKGDLAFFYHSNCKEPGIVGTMEIVQEHSPDLSAHDPKAPYYDASSKPEDPKWSVVHVKFRSKFATPITLKDLRAMGAPGKPLENMQMLKQTRLSVSRVTAAEWEHLMGVAEEM